MFESSRIKVLTARNKQPLPSQVRFGVGQARIAHHVAAGVQRQPQLSGRGAEGPQHWPEAQLPSGGGLQQQW